MNAAQGTPWSEEESLGQMVPQDMDFSNLLDLGDIDVSNFSLPDSNTNDRPSQYTVQAPDASFTDMASSTATHDFASAGWDMAMDMDPVQTIHSHAGSQENLQGFSQQLDPHGWHAASQQHSGHLDNHVGNMVFTHPQQIPPTPNSYELHGGDPLHMSKASMARHRQTFMNQQPQHQLHLNQATTRDTFTPLVSPAVTPQDSVFQRPHEFTVPGAYFSPLNSPALQAQNAGHHFRLGHAGTQPSTAGTSAATSPNSNDFDMPAFGTDSAIAMPDRSRKAGSKKPSASRSLVSRSGVRQSPVSKPQKRKSNALSTAISNQDLDNLLQKAQGQQSQVTLPAAAASSTDGSGGGSISPEPLTESLMGPPPRPGTSSTHQSPTLYGQVPTQQQIRFTNLSGAPATPASLMSIDNPRRQGSQTPNTGSGQAHPLANVDAPPLDDFVLPPSATSNITPGTPQLDSSSNTPRIAISRKTPKLTPLSTASAGRSMSATSSPAISAMASPSGAMTPQMSKDSRMRGSKKRSSVSGGSSLVSPALRPKISPSIKPLLPEGATLNDSQHALLLASKSNYTHLLEGTLLPGVSYPDSLSSGLTSKRTSHKIAEQGRRNRINEALKEMQALLPPPAVRPKSKSDAADGSDSPDGRDQGTADEDQDLVDQADAVKAAAGKKDKSGKAAKESPKTSSAAAEAKAANSKAATVESAIDYIRALQHERLAIAEAMKAKDSEVNELRRKLRDAEFKLGTANSQSPQAEACMTDPS